VRKLLPIMAVAVLGFALVGPAPAQFSLTSLTGGSTKAPTTSSSLPTTVGVTQMLPKYNINQMMPNGPGNARTFNFAKMLPNFSFVSSRWPLKTGSSQIPPQFFGTKK
jgi:hypothetical protein